MSRVAIVYWSGTGNTELMARGLELGADEAGAEVAIFQAATFAADMVSEFDALAFGCPACGEEELDEGEFLPMWKSVKGALGNKPIILFGSYGWGGGEWLEIWKSESPELNIIADLACEGEPTEDAQLLCKELGGKLVKD